MRANRSALSRRIFVLYLLILTFGGVAFASSEKVLHSFLGSPDGLTPGGALVADTAGNLYGVTSYGGPDPECSCGTVFELSPPATLEDAWTETILHSFFGSDGAANEDGLVPTGALVFDKLGNLYGETMQGGLGDGGTVFELTPPATPGGTWTETVIFSFPRDGKQGLFPTGNPVFDEAGNLYGTTNDGGGGRCVYTYEGCGTVFQLKPPAAPGGLWTENTLYEFGVQLGYGAHPESGVIYRDGALYGTTRFGGAHSRFNAGGTAYRLALRNGLWVADTLYSFSANKGSDPHGLILDDAGNLYGTFASGGSGGPNCGGCGAVFELSPPTVADKPWRETTLFAFQGESDGAAPFAALVGDDAGNLYGTTAARRIHDKDLDNTGLIFELSPPQDSGGPWTEKVLHNFGGSGNDDGAHPQSELIWLNGRLYGTTYLGGTVNGGTVYSVLP